MTIGTLTPRLGFGPFTFDPGSRLLRRGDEVLALPPRVLAVLELLLQRPGEVVSKQELIDTVWKDAFVTDTSLSEAVSVLRQALGDDPQSPSYVQTVHRRGYRFVAPVRPLALAPPDIPRAADAMAAPEHVSPSIGLQLVPWSVAVLCAAAAASAVWQIARQPSSAPAIVRFDVTPVLGTRFDGRAPALALSPDGTRIAWSACDQAGCRLYWRSLERLEAVALTGTDDAAAPFFSADGKWIGYFADGKLRKIAVAGGAPVSIADAADALGAVWTQTEEIIFAGARTGLTIVRDDGRHVRALTTPAAADGEVRHAWPSLAPDGTTLLFTIETAPSCETPPRLAVTSLSAGTDDARWKTILDGAGRALAVSNDALVFTRGTEVAAIAFDPARLAVTGTSSTIVTDVGAVRSAAQFAAAASGTFAYVTIEAPTSPPPKYVFASPTLSPDGSYVAAAVAEGVRSDIWIAAVANGAATRITHDGTNITPVWHPDGSVVYFAKRADRRYEVWKRDSRASALEQRVFAASGHTVPASVSADGSTLLVSQYGGETGLDVWAVPIRGGSPRPLIQTRFDETAASLSADGRFVAYQSNESGRWEIYVMRLDDGRRAVVSARGGINPSWEPEGLRIRYDEATTPMVATIASGADLQVVSSVASPNGRRPVPNAIDATGKFVYGAGTQRGTRAVVTLSFERVVRELLGPQPGAMPR